MVLTSLHIHPLKMRYTKIPWLNSFFFFNLLQITLGFVRNKS